MVSIPDSWNGLVLDYERPALVNLEYAKGKGDNEGVYLKFGYGL